MDDQLILVEFQWKFSSAGEFISEVLSGVLFQPVRQLFRTDVTALSVMGTAFRDQDFVTVFQSIDCLCAIYQTFQIALISGEKNVESFSIGDYRYYVW